MTVSLYHVFEVLIIAHIVFGAPGLIIFWIPVIFKKGGNRHRFWGRIFAFAMLMTATFAIGMSTMSVIAPMATHPHLVDHPVFSDPQLVRAIFGWMMLYLAILTINLTWYAWCCVTNKLDHAANQKWHNMLLQAILTIASINCAVQGFLIGQMMMVGFSIVGFATVGTNLWFILKKKPGPVTWLLEHIKGIIGTGISVYTAFFAFGAVRMLPEAALSPVLWSVPLVTGLALIFYHRHQVSRRVKRKPADGGRTRRRDRPAMAGTAQP
ncbi:MAG: hypothetical protein AAF615_08175 [Pseudomonadota bacterium]